MINEVAKGLEDKSIAVIGAGGLGGYIIGLSSRLPLKKIYIFDGDVFSQSNMDRQLYCTKETIGKSKALIAAEKCNEIGVTEAVGINEYFTIEHCEKIMNVDCIVDATDNIAARLMLEKVGEILNIPIIHGAIDGFFGHVAVVKPGEKTLSKLYANKGNTAGPTLSFVPSIIASIEVSQMAKLLCCDKTLGKGELLMVDLNNDETRVIKI